MNCMKCGTNIPESQVFCDHCLEVMKRHPVKPGTHVHLPKHNLSPEQVRKPQKKKRALSAEEQLPLLRRKVLRLRLLAVVLVFVICVLGSFLGLKLYQNYSAHPIGRNYTIDTSMNN